MRIQRDGDRVTVILDQRYVKLAVAMLVAAAGAAALVFWGPRARRGAAFDAIADSAAWAGAPRFEVATSGRPFRGPAAAPVTIVEFTDYLCPFCRRHATETLPRLLARQGDRIRYVVRHFPVQSLNPSALPAAEAVECAHQQGRFWEYREALYRGPTALTPELLRQYAAQAGLDTAAFGGCVDTRATRDVVARDLLDAWERGVSVTPTFFINGRRLRGLRSLEQFDTYVELAARTGAR